MPDQESQSPKRSVFISYSRKDKEFVRRLNDSLDSSEIEARVDWEGIPPSAEWMDEIARAIEGADAFIFVISPDSLASKVCGEELELGIKNNKKIIPILHRAPQPGISIHDKLSSHNWVYFREEDNYGSGIAKVFEAVNIDLEWVRQHTRLLQCAAEWDRKNRNNSFLLQGSHLEDAEHWMIEASKQENREVVPLQAEYISASRRAFTKRQRNVMVGISLALVVSIVLGIFALAQKNIAVNQEKIAKQNEASADGTACVWHFEAGEKRFCVQKESVIYGALFSRDGQYPFTGWEDGFLRIWDANNEELRKEFECGTTLWDLSTSPDSRWLAIGESDGDVIIWNVLKKFFLQGSKHEDEVYVVAFSPDSRWVVTAEREKNRAILYDQETQKTTLLQQNAKVLDVALNSQRSLAATAGDNAKIILWDLASGERVFELQNPTSVFSIVFDPHWTLLATGLSGRILIWDLETREQVTELLQAGNIRSLAYSDDGQMLASASEGGSVPLASQRSGDQLDCKYK